jgi:hypothetical protein
MSYEPFKIIALDPGKTTGVAVYTYRKVNSSMERFWIRRQITELHSLWKLLATENPEVIVYETFLQSFGAGATDFSAVEAIGVIKLYSQATDKMLIPQARQVKNFWTDEKIKTLSLWESGTKHAMDATRHMLYYLMQEQGEEYYINRLKRPSPAG